MKQEISAGAIVYYRDPETQGIEYLVLHYAAGHWDFPKGKIEQSETLRDAAHREVKEETGLDVILDKDFEQSLSYYFKDKTGVMVSKTVTFYIAPVTTLDVILSAEHIYYKWLPFEEARRQLSFANSRQLLQMADRYIHSRESIENSLKDHLTMC